MTTDWQELVYRFRWQISFLLVGLILAAGGVFLTLNKSSNKTLEIIDPDFVAAGERIVVEVSGEVRSPGVYELESQARIEDALKIAGGVSEDADTQWIEKYLNRAAYVTDGQKIYIPSHSEGASDNNSGVYQNSSEVLSGQSANSININTASQQQLESLPGIGPVYAQKIIDNRPYSSVEELSVKDIIPEKTYQEIKDNISVY